MKEQGPEKEWCWPVRREAYDCASALTEAEISFLATAHCLRINYSGPRFPALAAVRRLIEPLDDVFRYIAVHKPKCDQLIALLLKEMDERQISFWGWQDQQWIEIVENHRYFAGWMIAAAYLLCDFQSLDAFPKRRQVFPSLAQRVFGAQRFAAVVTTVRSELAALGYKPRTLRLVEITIAQILLSMRSVRIEDLTMDVLCKFQTATPNIAVEKCLIALSRLLASKGLLKEALPRSKRPRYLDQPAALLAQVAPEWARQARYWYDFSTLSAKTRVTRYYRVLSVGRWLQATHPEIQSTDQWTRTTASEAVAMLASEKCGEWSHRTSEGIRNFGRVRAANSHLYGMNSLRHFFQDLQQWEVIRRRFDPYRAFRCPNSVTCLIERKPRVLPDDVWAKLIWVGMNLTKGDLRGQGGRGGSFHLYPFLYVRAVAMVWLFAGLRWNEIRRLRLGCIRWQHDSSDGLVCLLSVPVNKSGSAFAKPVDKLVGETIEAWQKDRPVQSKMIDSKTGEDVDYLFLFRMRRLGESYLNQALIPALCKKAGVPTCDVRGRITGHWARSTAETAY